MAEMMNGVNLRARESRGVFPWNKSGSESAHTWLLRRHIDGGIIIKLPRLFRYFSVLAVCNWLRVIFRLLGRIGRVFFIQGNTFLAQNRPAAFQRGVAILLSVKTLSQISLGAIWNRNQRWGA